MVIQDLLDLPAEHLQHGPVTAVHDLPGVDRSDGTAKLSAGRISVDLRQVTGQVVAMPVTRFTRAIGKHGHLQARQTPGWKHLWGGRGLTPGPEDYDSDPTERRATTLDERDHRDRDPSNPLVVASRGQISQPARGPLQPPDSAMTPVAAGRRCHLDRSAREVA